MTTNIPNDPNVLFTKQNIWGHNKDVTLNDLSKVRGKGMWRVVAAYNQVKLFLTRGFVIRERDIEGFVKTLNPERLKVIDDKFKEALTADADGQKETKQTIKIARAYSKVLKNHFDTITKENIRDLSRQEVKDFISNPKYIATKLETALFIDQNMDDLLKSVLYAQRSNPQKVLWGPANDFIKFINDNNMKIETDAQLKDAVKEFEKDILESNIYPSILKKYQEDKQLKVYKKLKQLSKFGPLKDEHFNASLRESPLETLKILQNKEKS